MISKIKLVEIETAFSQLQEIMLMSDDIKKQRAWLKQYGASVLCRMYRDEPLLKESSSKALRDYKDEDFEASMNLAQMPRLIVIEPETKFPDGTKDIETIKKQAITIKEWARKKGIGCLETKHKTRDTKETSPYFYFECDGFYDIQARRKFIHYIASISGGAIDENFASPNWYVQVPFAIHSKHSDFREVPNDYIQGKQLCLNALNLPNVKGKIEIKENNFQYKTFIPEEREPLLSQIKVYTIKDFYGQEEKENPIIENLIPEKSVSLIFGESGSLKSVFTIGAVSHIATGRKFLGLKTRKVAVLYLSTENPIKTEKRRFRAVFKGMKINAKRRKFDNLQLLCCGRKGIGVLNNEKYYNALKEIILNNHIGLVVIDTLAPLILDINDNSAQEIVNIFNNKLFPLVDEMGVSIIIIHHAQKTGKDFLGSIKIKASCDNFYEIRRKENNVLNVLCHKSRDSEEYNLDVKVIFEKKGKKLHKITIDFLKGYYGKQSPSDKNNNPIEQGKATELILSDLEENELSYNEMVKLCTSNGVSSSTAKRTIKKLYETKVIAKKHGKSGGYYIL